ncbi:prion-like-(Q/N-rich) domain-bearing protein 25 [Cotesia glomerata]|uniref:prion-like-(Q/N-rich) domain-bearing protein 25 n=1 Tax=Cotesia glomerata TaxID=32391 RepID=UPI001D031076|nr:prion-like-(Q/N-rich) domain-bearing protein 25 [Cotesia glomerata]
MTPKCLLILLVVLVFRAVTGSKFVTNTSAVAPGDDCYEPMDCAHLENSYCSADKKCICIEGYVPRNEHCVPAIGTKCDDKDCKLNNTRCIEGTCQCAYGFVALSKVECLRISEHGKKCENDIQCSCKNFGTCDTEEPYTDVFCAGKKCSCLEDYHYVPGKYTCVKSAQKLGHNCTVTDSCLPVKNTECIEDRCSCPDKHFVEQDQCLSGIGATCAMYGEDCKANNSRCGFFGCKCYDKFVELSVKQCVPIKKKGEDCLIDEQCSCENNGRCYLGGTYKDVICSKKTKICSCSEGFHYVPEQDSCVHSATAIDDSCTHNDNCLLLSNTQCKEQKCQCIANYFNYKGQCRQGLNSRCAENSHCSAVENSQCIDNECQCNNNFVPISTGICAAIASYGEPCQFQEQCRNNGTLMVPYEELVCDGTCSCSNGFHYVDSKRACIESSTGVGGNCSVNDHCGRLTNTLCWDNKCSCLEYHYQRKEQCVPGIGAHCFGNCETTNSICGSTGRCICAPGHIFAAEDRCVPIIELGENCEMDEQCSCLHQKCDLEQPNRDLVCSSGTCGCPANYHFSSKSKFCIHSATGIGEQCSTDENCAKLLFAECHNNKCMCKPNYFSSEGNCKIGLNAKCNTTSHCSAVEHTECRNGECKCTKLFVERSTELCVPVSSFGGDCEFVEQCTSQTSNATCEAPTDGANKVCRCGTGQHYHATGCFLTRTLDERCDSDSECFVTSKYDSVACVRNKCVCVKGFEKVNGTFCGGAGSIFASALLVFLMVVVKSAV